MLHLGWIGGYKMVHACYRSLQIYCIIMQWHRYLVEKVWNVCKSNARWWQILQCSRYTHLPFRAKVFIRRVMIGGLPLGSTLKRRGLGLYSCFFCTIPLEDIMPHRFIKPIVIWDLNNGFFSQYVQNGPNDEMEILFQFLQYRGL